MSAIKWLAIIGLCVAGIVSCATSDWYVEYERSRAAAQAEANKPRVISTSDDGCSVYTFKAGGDWRYFTRCGSDKVTTERNYSVPCGKARCTRTETIETLQQQER